MVSSARRLLFKDHMHQGLSKESKDEEGLVVLIIIGSDKPLGNSN